MSGYEAFRGEGAPDDSAARWRALSGDAPAPVELPQVPHLTGQPASSAGWQYPYDVQRQVEQPPYEGAAAAIVEPQPAVEPQQEPTFVAPEQLEQVGPPRYLAPQRQARDPRQRTMATVITFVSLVIALWGILGFLGSLSKTLSSISAGNQKLKAQLTTANEGLASLDTKTKPLNDMADSSKELAGLLGGIDEGMGSMLSGVDEISDNMTAMDASLQELDSSLGTVNDINASMAGDLGTINSGLQGQVRSVRSMRRDVQATSRVIGQLPKRLDATNGRLTFVNGAVNTMGCRGVTNQLKVKINVGPIPNGSADVFATVIPAGAWGTQADGRTPC